MIGTPPYMAPEFWDKNSEKNRKVDVWSIGHMLHQMLFGDFYYSNNDPAKRKIYDITSMNGQEKLSTNCRNLLKKMLETSPSDRYSIEEVRGHPAFDSIRQNFDHPESVIVTTKVTDRSAELTRILVNFHNISIFYYKISDWMWENFGKRGKEIPLCFMMAKRSWQRFQFEFFMLLKKRKPVDDILHLECSDQEWNVFADTNVFANFLSEFNAYARNIEAHHLFKKVFEVCDQKFSKTTMKPAINQYMNEDKYFNRHVRADFLKNGSKYLKWVYEQKSGSDANQEMDLAVACYLVLLKFDEQNGIHFWDSEKNDLQKLKDDIKAMSIEDKFNYVADNT